ncbi:MAG TPA: hypothetical protein VGN12_05725 [Pirellulales bacterium]|jgi:hypothetical protein
MRRILSIVLIAALFSGVGCRRLPQRDESPDGVAPKKQGFSWDNLRDKRAVEVERHMDDVEKQLDRDELRDLSTRP